MPGVAEKETNAWNTSGNSWKLVIFHFNIDRQTMHLHLTWWLKVWGYINLRVTDWLHHPKDSMLEKLSMERWDHMDASNKISEHNKMRSFSMLLMTVGEEICAQFRLKFDINQIAAKHEKNKRNKQIKK